MSEHSTCPIWETPAIEQRTGDGETVDSPRAGGRYSITGRAVVILQSRDESLKSRLTSWLIEQRRLGVDCPKISTTNVDEIEQRRSLSVHQRADNLLRYIQEQIPKIGTPFGCQIHETDPTFMETLAWSESTKIEEVLFLVDSLESQGWLSPDGQAIGSLRYSITVEGYSYLAEIDHAVTDSAQAFVAMWFGKSMDEVWRKGLQPAIRDAGYEALRIDQKEHLNKVDDEIIAEIRRSRFLVADFTQGETGPRGGVYYEAGFAHGLNIPVVFTCRKDALEKIHFDTRQYPHIVWKTPEELRDSLAERISAVLGDGPLKS